MRKKLSIFHFLLSARSRGGFTLVELLVFVAIFAGISIAFVAILVSVAGVQTKQFSAAVVNQESQFVLQTIQRLVEGASLIEMPKDLSTSNLKLRMPGSAKDPTYVYLSSGTIYLKETEGGVPEPLTSSRVTVPSLTFTKRANTSGKDAVSVTFLIEYNTANLKQKFARSLRTSIARVSAATFDSDIRASSTNTYKIGAGAAEWQSINNTIYFSGSNVGIGVSSPGQTLEVNGGVRINTTAAQPACNASLRGTFWVVQAGAGLKDRVEVCVKNASDVYLWATIY
jgi:type II secretory pathway pseudopilin PulG